MDRRFFIIFLVVFTNLLGAGVVIPTLPLYAEQRFGANALQAGSFIALYYILQFFAAPILGQLSDRYGRRPILIWSQVGTVASFGLFILAGPLTDFFAEVGVPLLSSGMMVLYLARGLDGFTGGNVTTAKAYITDIASEQTRAQALAYIHVAFALGIVFGPALGGILSAYGFLAPFYAAMLFSAVSLLLSIFILPESLSLADLHGKRASDGHAWQAWRELLRSNLILTITTLSFVVNFMMASLTSVFPLYAEYIIFTTRTPQVVARNVGLMMAFVGVVAIIGQLFIIRPAVKRFGEENMIMLSITLAWITCLALSLFSNAWLITLFLIPAGIAYALGVPSGEALLVRFGDNSNRGQLMGLYQAANSMAFVIGPLIGGFLFDLFTPRTPFVFSTILIICSLWLAFQLRSRTVPNKRLHNSSYSDL